MPDEKKDSEVIHAFYVVYNERTKQYGVIGAPGFFDDKQRAYYALHETQRLIDKFYADQEKFGNRIITAGKNALNRLNFRSFIKGKN